MIEPRFKPGARMRFRRRPKIECIVVVAFDSVVVVAMDSPYAPNVVLSGVHPVVSCAPSELEPE